MSGEVESCKGETFQPYNPDIACKPYETSIFSQLSKEEQGFIKACGVARVAPTEALENMLLNINYLDMFLKKKEGAPFSLESNFDDVFLKTPAITTFPDKLMTIPRIEKETSTADEAAGGPESAGGPSEPEKKEISITWTAPPNQVGAFSHFLNINPNPAEEREYETLLLECEQPPHPPPPPPEMLQLQQMSIQIEEMIQLKLLIIVEELANFLKDSLKETSILKERAAYETLVRGIRAAKKKEEEYAMAIETYNTMSMQTYLTYEQMLKLQLENESRERELNGLIAFKKKFELFQKNDSNPKIDMTQFLKTVGKTVAKKVKQSIQGTIDSVAKKMPFYPDENQIRELEKAILDDKQFISNYESQLELLKVNLTTAESKLPADYKKTALQTYVDTLAGITRVVSVEEKEKRKMEKQKYQEDCKKLQTLETTEEEKTYSTIVPYFQTVQQRFAERLVKQHDLTAKSAIVINLLANIPIPKDHDFDSFKDIWSNADCEVSPYFLPSTATGKSTSFILPTFVTFLNLYFTHMNDPSATLDKVILH